MIWKKQSGKNHSQDCLHFGKIIVGCVYYDGCTSQTQKEKYKGVNRLPGLDPYVGHFLTDTEAKKAVENHAKVWLELSNLKEV